MHDAFFAYVPSRIDELTQFNFFVPRASRRHCVLSDGAGGGGGGGGGWG